MNPRSLTPVLVLVLVFLLAFPAFAAGAGERPRVSADTARLPQLKAYSDQVIDLSFPAATSVLDVYRALAKACSFNVQLDARLKDMKVDVELEAVTPREALDTVMHVASHFYKVLDGNTILILDDTPRNRRTYEDQVVRTFYLENVEVKDMMTAVRSLLGAKNVSANETLSSLTLRDTADKVAVAEKLVDMHDRPRGEVAIDVELLRLDSEALRKVLERRKSEEREGTKVLRLTAPELAELKQAASPRTLADLQLSVLHGEQARLRATDRVPLLVSAGEESYQYQDVGLDVRIGAQVHPRHREVTLHLQLELSHPAYDLATTGGSLPVFTSRGVELSARLGDGETYLLTGLKAGDDVSGAKASRGATAARAYLRDPFADPGEDAGSEVVLTVTPWIVRGLDAEEEALRVGTETHITLRGGSRALSELAGPFDPPRAADEASLHDERPRKPPRGERQERDGSGN